jgi:hypothetical protein
MKIDLQQPVAVITGDIVGSGKFFGAARRRLHAVMQEIGEQLQQTFS